MDYLMDRNFLSELDKNKEKEVYIKIIALSKDEYPIETIEGKATGGSVNVDGDSAVRRTCSLSLIAQDININDYYWGLRNKFKLEIGLKNKIDNRYPDIVWFKMGTYVITSFNTSQSVNNYTINISGKDKMCLLNGDLGGALPASTKLHLYEDENGIYHNIIVYNIIFNLIWQQGGELPHNIIIEDLEDRGLELLEYRGENNLYLLKDIDQDIYTDMITLDTTSCYGFDGETGQPLNNGESFDIVDLDEDKYEDLIKDPEDTKKPAKISFQDPPNPEGDYTVAKREYGQVVGYRETDLVYPGELIGGAGETIASILDKIKATLGEFEYFYDLDGRFVFRRKPYSIIIDPAKNGFTAGNVLDSDIAYKFVDGVLISSFSNNPNLLNLKNDYIVWGKTKNELPIHMRYALDKKPKFYRNFDGENFFSSECVKYSANNRDVYDWRELIFQMQKDFSSHSSEHDFFHRIIENNYKYAKDQFDLEKQRQPQYSTEEMAVFKDIVDNFRYAHGQTGYELYYPELQGFWRDNLYNPNPSPEFDITAYNNLIQDDNEIYEIYVKGFEELDRNMITSSLLDKLYVYDTTDNLFDFLDEESDNLIDKDLAKLSEKGLSSEQFKEEEANINEYYASILTGIKSEANKLMPFLNSYYCKILLNSDGEAPEEYYSLDVSEGDMNAGTRSADVLNNRNIKDLYVKNQDADGNPIKKILFEGIFGYQVNEDKDQDGKKDKYPFITAEVIKPQGIFYCNDGSPVFVQTIIGSDESNYSLHTKGETISSFILGTGKNVEKDTYLKFIWKKFFELQNKKVIIDNKETFRYRFFIKSEDKQFLHKRNKEGPLQDTREGHADNLDEIFVPYFYNAEEYIESLPALRKTTNCINADTFTENKEYFPAEQNVFYKGYYEYYLENTEDDDKRYWKKDYLKNKDTAIFWFDFLDVENSELNKFSVPVIGSRRKVVNDDKVKIIFSPEIPNVIFHDPPAQGEELEKRSGYVYIQLQPAMQNLFTISSLAKSAQETIEELLFQHTCSMDNISFSSIPIYYLEPNNKVQVRDEKSKINGEYIIKKLTYSLTYNGMMNVSAVKYYDSLF